MLNVLIGISRVLLALSQDRRRHSLCHGGEPNMCHQAWCSRSRLVATVPHSLRMLNRQSLVQVGRWEAVWAVSTLVVHIKPTTLEATLMVKDDRPFCRGELRQRRTIHTCQGQSLHRRAGGHHVAGASYPCRSSTNQGSHTPLFRSVNLLRHRLRHLPLPGNKLILYLDRLDPIPKWHPNVDRGLLHL